MITQKTLLLRHPPCPIVSAIYAKMLAEKKNKDGFNEGGQRPHAP
ncbi:hypothetical protein [Rhizobium sp. 007]|nr:hypothetical protein [Rhizobium sp. 007]